MGNNSSNPNSNIQRKAPELLADYILGEVLGQGNFGIVYSCRKIDGNGEFAVKMIDKVESTLEEIRSEVDMLDRLKHKLIVRVHAVYYGKVFVCVVMDMLKGGDLIDGMQRHWKEKGEISPNTTRRICRMMLGGVAWLHTNNVVHRDVKGDNFLTDRPNIADAELAIRLSDFGTAVILPSNKRLNKPCGTKLYWSPENYKLNYAHKVDVWAIGVVSYGLVRGNFPFRDEVTVNGKEVRLPSSVPANLNLFVCALLCKKEDQRPSANDALAHAFLTEGQTACATPVVAEKLEIDPSMKEKANDDRANRRRTLVRRLERAAQTCADFPNARSRAYSNVEEVTVPKWSSQFGQPGYEVVDKREQRTIRYEWWDAQRVGDCGAIDLRGARPFQAESEHASTDEEQLRLRLESHGINTKGFGKGQAKTISSFLQELRSGESRLLLDASKHKTMVRVVDLVVLRLYNGPNGVSKFCIKVGEHSSTTDQGNKLHHLPGMKKRPHENVATVAKRILAERLQMADAAVIFDFEGKKSYEDEEDSPSYPGVRTVYRKTIVAGEVQLNGGDGWKLRLNSGEKFPVHDSKGITRYYQWLKENDCKDKGVMLFPQNENPGDISALVQAPPAPYDSERIKKYLKQNNIELSTFPLAEFEQELADGEAVLETQLDGSVLRLVDLVVLHIVHETTGAILMTAKRTVKHEHTVVSKLPGTKLLPNENQFLTAHRILQDILHIDEDYIEFRHNDVQIVEETKDSEQYRGLRSRYRKRIIFADARKSVDTHVSAYSPRTPRIAGTPGAVDNRDEDEGWAFACFCRTRECN